MGLMGLTSYKSYKSYKSYSRCSTGAPRLQPLRLSGEIQLAALLVEIDENGLAVADFAFQDAASERRFDLALDRAFERARAVERVIAHGRQMRARRVGQFQADVTFGQALPQPVELYLHDLFQAPFRQGMEDDDLVYAIEEFGPEVMAHLFQHRPLHSLVSFALECAAVFQDAVAADVRGHDHNRVFEIHDAALSVGQPPVVQNLQHDVEDVVMSLIDLVEEDHRIGTPPDGLSQLSALFVTDVAWRRADQPGHGVPLLVFRHINTDHRALVVEEKFGQRPRQLRFADAGRS